MMPPKPIVYLPVCKTLHPQFSITLYQIKFEERRARRLIVADRAVEAKRSRTCLAAGFHLPKALSCLRPSPIQSPQLHENILLGTVHRPADRMRDEVAFVPLSAERGLSGAHPTFATRSSYGSTATSFPRSGCTDLMRRSQVAVVRKPYSPKP